MKRLLIVAFAVLAVVGAFLVVVPFVLSTAPVKQRIADQLADWTGRKVTFTGDPRVGAFPDLRVVIPEVTIGDPAGDAPFISMQALTSNMRLLPLLFGRVEIAEFRLTRPQIHLRRNQAENGNWELRQVSREHRRPGPKTLLRLSKIVIVDGAITYDEAATGHHEAVTDASLSLSWPSAIEPLVVIGTFKWRGETVEFNGSIGDPIGLNEGKVSPARFAVASTPIRASFSGNVSRFADLQVEGPTTLSTPSLRRLIAWLGSPSESGSTLGAASIEGKLNWTRPSISFSEARVELDGNTAEGTLAASLDAPRPSIQGTLAFDKLDLSPYLEAFRAELNASGPGATAPIRMPALAAADVDLRLSTEQILLGPARIGNVAIAAAVKDGKLAVEIGDAQFYSGSLAATLTAEMRGDAFASNIEARMSGVPAGVALTDFTGVTGLDGTGAATVSISGSGQSWGEFAHTLAGTAKLTLADGTLAGFDLPRVAALLGRTAATGAAGSGSTAFATAACDLTISRGTISTGNLRAVGPDYQIDFAGDASLFRPDISGRGTLTLGKEGASQASTALPFELSGTWQEPELFPDLGRIIKRSDQGTGTGKFHFAADAAAPSPAPLP